VGYVLLRRLMEQATRSELPEAVENLVFEPLDIRECRIATSPSDMEALAFPVPPNYHPGWVFHGVVVGPIDQAAQTLYRLLQGRLLDSTSIKRMLHRHRIGGAVPGRPWTDHGYGLGLMVGAMNSKELNLEQDLLVCGHSACGPGSSGAVYAAVSGPLRVAAVFSNSPTEGAAEHLALLKLADVGCGSPA
jgi:D-alanyl-D-alanine carboxypeptidase